MSTDWYKKTAAITVVELNSSVEQGLTSAEAQRRLAETGANELVEKGGRTPLQILWEQFSGILTMLLLVAALISIVLNEWVEAIAIIVIVILNGLLGYFQESRAEQSMAALKRMSVPIVRVRRDGRVQEVSARDLVPGDIVILETGNIVPADGRVLASANLRIEEAALTGESEPVEKDAGLLFDADKALGDRRNMVYSGTIVNYGRGEFVVTGTGMQTELGHIATLIQGVEDDSTPLQDRLHNLGRTLAYAALALVAVVIALGLLRGERDLETLLLTAVSLAVAAIPEALTAVVTIALSLGAQRMLKRQALIRRLPAVETLGSVNVICSDKTGTLTINRMTVTAVDIANHTYSFNSSTETGAMRLVPAEGTTPTKGAQPALDLLMVAGALNNDAILNEDAEEGGNLGFSAVGDPTEGALVLAAALTDLRKQELEQAFPRVAEVPFDSTRKRMTTLHTTPANASDLPSSLVPVWERRPDPNDPLRPYIGFTKGAIDGILTIADRVYVEGKVQPLTDEWKQRVMSSHDEMAAKGMRVLGVALRTWDKLPAEINEKTAEDDLILVGMFGMIDPPRPEVRDAVAECRSAGIRPVMITGDHPLTARHIAQQIGITDNDLFLSGQELDRMSPSELLEASRQVSVFARVSPEHKLKLIDAFQQQDNIVAMTGDGVNDAPALKKADIGVAMGITGTDVAKGAAEMVLLDDNFATIVLGMPLPLRPLQILWMNLVTDGLPALALGVEPPEKDVMNRPPYSATESVFGRGMVQFIILFGIILSLIAIGAGFGLWREGDPAWQTALFTTLVFSQLAMAISVRSEKESIFRHGLFTNRYMILAVVVTIALQLLIVYWGPAQAVFDTTALNGRDLALCFGLSLLVLVTVEIWKFFVRRRDAA